MTTCIDLFQAADVDEIKSAALAAYKPIATERMKSSGMCDMLSAARSKVSYRHIDLLLKAGMSKPSAADLMSEVWGQALKCAKGGAA